MVHGDSIMGSSLSSSSRTRSPFYDYDNVIDIESLENAGDGRPITSDRLRQGGCSKANLIDQT